MKRSYPGYKKRFVEILRLFYTTHKKQRSKNTKSYFEKMQKRTWSS